VGVFTVESEGAVGRGGRAAEKTIDEESANARAYLQALGEQLVVVAQQLDESGRNDDGTKEQSP